MRHRIWRPVAVLLASMTVLVGTTGTASAHISWPRVQMVNQASQECLKTGGGGGVTEPGCMAGGFDFVALGSQYGDGSDSIHGTYARVAICFGPAPQQCLQAGPNGSGPNGPSSSSTFWAPSTQQLPQIWDMWTAAPPQNVGNPAGLKHFIGFYNEATHTCLDGGWGVYGFSASDCSKTNNWQIWNIYTDLGSW